LTTFGRFRVKAEKLRKSASFFARAANGATPAKRSKAVQRAVFWTGLRNGAKMTIVTATGI
jgi:hypothetical protein